jgi:hypothetical protein
MPQRDGPTWPISIHVIRLTLMRSRLDTLHKPEIEMVGVSHKYGWARYTACVADPTYEQFETRDDFYHAVVGAFCEPLSDFVVRPIDEGRFIAFTLFVTKATAKLRLKHINMGGEEWHKKFKD